MADPRFSVWHTYPLLFPKIFEKSHEIEYNLDGRGRRNLPPPHMVMAGAEKGEQTCGELGGFDGIEFGFGSLLLFRGRNVGQLVRRLFFRCKRTTVTINNHGQHWYTNNGQHLYTTKDNQWRIKRKQGQCESLSCPLKLHKKNAKAAS